MALNKIATTQLDTTAYYQKLLDLDVRFFVNDDNTAILEFPITRNKNPVPLSNVNVKSYIAIITPDGSHKIDYLEFYDELNGVLRYTLPNDVLAQVGKHHAQVYISVNGVKDVVVERKISFNVEDDYINSIDSDTKLSYIRMFDDLYAAIQQRAVDIENAINNSADYVSQLEQAREKGLTDIEIAKTDNIKTLNDLADIRLEEMNSKGVEYSTKFDADKQYMDEKHESFKESVLNSEVVTQGESKEWQKYKLTNDTGNQIAYFNGDYPMTNENLLSAKTGFYYNLNYQDAPSGTTGFVYVTENGGGGKKIYYSSYSRNDLYIKSYSSSIGWIDWKEIVTLSPNEEIETQNSAESRANETIADANRYTDEQLSKQHTVLFEGSANGVGTSIALSDSLTNYNAIIVSGNFPGGRFNESHLLYNNNGISINKTNIANSDGNNPVNYEIRIEITDQNTLKINNEVKNNLFQSNAGSNSETHFKVERIEGWK